MLTGLGTLLTVMGTSMESGLPNVWPTWSSIPARTGGRSLLRECGQGSSISVLMASSDKLNPHVASRAGALGATVP